MSAFVLNRNYELQLPSNFVDVDREEMEYVDGGFSMQTYKVLGIPVAANLSFSNGDLWALTTSGAGMAALLAIWCPEPLISKVIASALIVSSAAIGIQAGYGKQLSISWNSVQGITQFTFY